MIALVLIMAATPGHVAHACSSPVPANADLSPTVRIDGRVTDPSIDGLTADYLGRSTWVRLVARRRRAPVCLAAVSMAGRHRVRATLRY